MPNKYDGESCEGCRFYTEFSGPECLHRNMQDAEGKRGCPDLHDRCENFVPSLLCRQVLAMEALAEYLGGCVRASEHGGYTFDLTR